MRVLHTSDWHLGRVLYNHARHDDEVAVLGEIVAIARREQPDLIVHAGDLFDAVRPPYEAMTLGLDTLRELAGDRPDVVVCGNHDSPALFRIFQKLLGDEARLRFVDRARRPGGRRHPRLSRSASSGCGSRRCRSFTRTAWSKRSRTRAAHGAYADRIGEIEGVLRRGAARRLRRVARRAALRRAPPRHRRAVLGQRARAPRLRHLRHARRASADRLLRRVRPHPPAAVAAGLGARPLRRLADPARLRRARGQQARGAGRRRAGRAGAHRADRARQGSPPRALHRHASSSSSAGRRV